MRKMFYILLSIILLIGFNVIANDSQQKHFEEAINEASETREFSWKTKREFSVDFDITGYFKQMMKGISKTVEDWFKWLADLLTIKKDKEVKDYSRGRVWQPSDKGYTAPTNSHIARSSSLLVYMMLFTIITIIITMIILTIKFKKKKKVPEVEEVSEEKMIDIMDEDLTADSLEESEWITLASKLLSEGKIREAIRAVFLGTIALLSEKGALTVKKSKSNREYLKEANRRYHLKQGTLKNFKSGILIFEQAWYGIDYDTLDSFNTIMSSYKEIRNGGCDSE